MITIRPVVHSRARVEIIPLIDVIFFLLATFVLFTLSLNRIMSLPADLPKTVDKSTPPPTDALVIRVSNNGTLYWQDELISDVELAPRLAAYKSSTPDPRVMIAGDSSAKLGGAVMVLDEVRLAGIEQVAIETRVRAGNL